MRQMLEEGPSAAACKQEEGEHSNDDSQDSVAVW